MVHLQISTVAVVLGLGTVAVAVVMTAPPGPGNVLSDELVFVINTMMIQVAAGTRHTSTRVVILVMHTLT